MRTVLIVDDSRTSQMLVKTTLQRLSEVQFLMADDGEQALEVVKQARVDLLVTDINMPKMDGIELIRQVRARHDARSLPILIITAKGEEQARDQGMALGANGYVLKPLSARELAEHAIRLLSTPAA